MVFSRISVAFIKTATCLSRMLLCTGLCFVTDVVFAKPKVTPALIETRYLALPAMPVDGVQYSALQGQYAVERPLGIAGIVVAPCDSDDATTQDKKVFLKIRYQGVSVLFRLRDRRRAINVYQAHYVLDETSAYGRERCSSETAQKADFEKNKVAWLKRKETDFLHDTQRKMRTFLKEQTAPRYESHTFTVFSVLNGGQTFAHFDQALDLMREAADLNNEVGITVEAFELLGKAGMTFERALEAHRVLASDFDREYKRALHRNLSVVYVLSGKLTKARQHDAYALSAGLPKRESLQDLIEIRQKRALMSPKSIRNPVAMANLYRMGQNAANYFELIELSLEDYLNAELRHVGQNN